MASLGPGSLGLQERLGRLGSPGSSARPGPCRPVRGRGARTTCHALRNSRRELRSERRAALSLAPPSRQSTSGLLDGLGGMGALSEGASRFTVAVDVDEVLGRFVFALNQFCKEEYGMDYCVSDYWIYEFAKIWNCSQDHSNHIVHEFFKSPHFNDGIPIIPGAYESLSRLSSHCDLVVVTSRQHIIQDVTLEWIDRHYGGLFKETYFGNHFALSGTSRKKSEICRSIGAHVLIDDNPGYALDCAHAGINVLLYDWHNMYPWSKLPEGSEHPNIEVVHNWEQVEASLVAMAAEYSPYASPAA